MNYIIEFLPSEAMTVAGGALFPVAVGLGSSVTHCAGMCGPIHFFLASHGGKGKIIWRYHAGRILGYSILGLAAGFLGSFAAGPAGEGFKSAMGYFLAGLYALFGLQLLGWLPPTLRLETHVGALFPSRLFGKLAAEGRAGSFLFPAGLLACLLPCPSTHAVLLFGMGLGEPALASAAMAALGASTLPVFALIPRRPPGSMPWARHYGMILGAVFLGLSAWRIYGAAFTGSPSCH